MALRTFSRILIFSFCFCTKFIFAQGIEGLKNYSVPEGLSQGNVTCITNDRLGFLWVGTDNGLNRFDGNTFKKYQNNPHDTTTLSSNYVSALAIDSSGQVWVGTENGIDIYNPFTDKITKFRLWQPPHRSKKIHINKLTFVDRDQLLVTTDVGFEIFDIAKGSSTPFFGMMAGTSDSNTKNFTAEFADKQNTVWLGTDNGQVWKYENGKVTHDGEIIIDKIGESQAINAISDYKSSENHFLVIASNSGIDFYNTKTHREEFFWKGKTSADTLPFVPFLDVLKINSHQFICLENRRISTIDFFTGKITDLINNEADDDKNFTNYHKLLLDRQGILWVADYGKGIWSYSTVSTKMTLVTSDPVDLNHVKNPNVLSFCEVGDSVYVGSEWGIDVLNLHSNRVTDFPLFPGKDAAENPVDVLSMTKGDEQNFWFFGRSSINGLANLNPKSGENKIYDSESGLIDTKVTGILKMKDGTFWMGTKDKGIEIYRPNDATCFFMLADSANPKSLSSNRINNLFLDSKGKIWASTDKGLNLVDPNNGSVKHYRLDLADSTSISSEDVNGVAEDLKGNIWVATNFGFGELIAAIGKFKNYSSDDGLPDNSVNGILADSLGYLWITTNNGLCRFDPEKEKITVYGIEDGLQGLEFNRGSMLYGKSGNVYFGGGNGFNYFNPHNVKENSFVPPVYITSMSIYGHQYSPDSNIILKKNIILDYKQNFLLFRFVALNFYMPDKNHFAVKMDGVDDDWVSLNEKKTISYPGLAPGEYVLHVKACNNDGIWNETGATLSITILPPFWRTKWFYTICILLGLFCIWGYTRLKEKKLRQEKIILENKVEERTTELRFEKEKVSAAHKDIQDSINYARRIQNTILHGEVEWKNLLPDSFVIYHPRDVVSGDFFWLYQQGEKLLIACADCTGHGVPGAFMSMIGHTHLNEIAGQEKVSDPGTILERLHKKVTHSLKQDAGSETRDGMDIALLSIDYKKGEVQYAGANRPLFVVRDGNAEDYKSDKYCIGGGYDIGTRTFVTNTIKIQKGDMLYMFSDGYADQFGGTKGKKFGKKQLRELLLKVADLSMEHQKEAIDRAYEEWKGELEQVDDILLIGIRI